MRKCWSLTFGVMFFLSLFIGVAMAVDNVIPMPCTIKAYAKVDGTVLTGVSANYTIKVTNTAGAEYVPVDTAGSSFGSPIAGRFQYNIPKYDGVDQRGGAATGAKACIAMYYNTTKLSVQYPAQGSCPAGSGEVVVQGDGEAIGFGGLNGLPNDAAHTFATPLTAVTANCQVTATPSSLAFGDVNLGSSKNLSTALKNIGTATCTVSSLTAMGPGFALVSPPAIPFTITPSNTTNITGKFSPTAKGPAVGSIGAISDGGQTTVPLSGTGLCALTLYQGWNLIGLPCAPTSSATGTVLQSIISDVSIVWGYVNQTGRWNLYDPTDPEGSTLTTMDVGNGYWIKMKAARTLIIN